MGSPPSGTKIALSTSQTNLLPKSIHRKGTVVREYCQKKSQNMGEEKSMRIVLVDP